MRELNCSKHLERFPSTADRVHLTDPARSARLPHLMLKSPAEGTDENIAMLYADMTKAIADHGGSLEGFMVGHEHGEDHSEKADANRPKAFYSVAIDAPGFDANGGRTAGPAHDVYTSADFLSEVTRCHCCS